MEFNPDVNGYPVGTTSSSTWTLNCYARSVQGSGAFSSAAPVLFATLVVSFPNGRADVKSRAALHDIAVAHLLSNTQFTDWWNPKIGTPEALVREALASTPTLHAWATNLSATLMFDGQFGPVIAA